MAKMAGFYRKEKLGEGRFRVLVSLGVVAPVYHYSSPLSKHTSRRSWGKGGLGQGPR